ncbi:glycine-rich protein 2-like [Mercurialis annua]|uniref:glycine-rich protein 2-like n=1 Tax=Mercurialis annua TaxID=3986 RepID=UPI0024AD4512|nr:glycine-rich protein 2-like [Mercurialis annua]
MPETKKATDVVHSSGQQGGSSNYQFKPFQYKSQKGGSRKGYQPYSHSSGYSGSSRGSGRGYSSTSSVPFCHNCMRRHPGQCQVAPGSCYACGQQGHFARECLASGQQMSSASRGRGLGGRVFGGRGNGCRGLSSYSSSQSPLQGQGQARVAEIVKGTITGIDGQCFY